MKAILQGISHLLAPRVCCVCGQSLSGLEDVMCLGCQLDIPRTDLHRLPFNIIHQRLGHQCQVDRAAGWFYYRKGSAYSHMLVEAKYNRLPELALKLGKMCAGELIADGFFDGIDMLVPMPMHWLKRLRRGYNQAEEVAIGVGRKAGLPVVNALKAVRSHNIQSRQGKQARFQNITDTMAVPEPSLIAGKHILLIDDIVTTGASMAEAIRAAQQAQPASISVLCLGLTQLA
ncbi:MAG: hypothetical protein LIP09_06225 [Bacteroidales bacterium]|nr:hypothetical protein [Bacteroidales bacterium]